MKLPSRPRLLGAGVIGLALGGLGFHNLLSRPGYEMALAAGLLCPSVAALVTASELARRDRAGLTMLRRALDTGVMLAIVAYVVACLHGMFAGFCDPPSGTLVFLLGPGFGTVLGSVWGAVAAEVPRQLGMERSRKQVTLRIGLALGGPLATAVLNLALFYGSPVVFAYDPFVGFFSGALYDTVLAFDGIWSYRAGSAATLLSCWVAAYHLAPDERGRQRYRPRRRPGVLAFGVLAAATSLGSVALGSRLGHWQTAATITTELGAQTTVGACHIRYDAGIPAEDLAAFAKDCDGHVTHLRAWLGLRSVTPVTVYLFRDVGQKRRLMGASRTSIAKPWRREVYLQMASYPHPILGHELAHVLAGELGGGPFGVPGALGGWLPNPGLIEGLAVAAAPRDDNLTADEWAAAMRRIEVLPPVEQLLSLSFYTSASSTGYTAAGSFVGHVRERFGLETLSRWYGGEALPGITGSSWQALEADWWQALDAIELSEAALHTAKARFDRPSVLARRCPHVVDGLMGEALWLCSSGNHPAGLATYDRVLELDPGSSSALVGRAACLDRTTDRDGTQSALDALRSDETVPMATRMQAEEDLGDIALRHGQVVAARRHYQAARETMTRESALRTLDVKHHYADQPEARAALVALLIGTSSAQTRSEEALDRIGAWRTASPEDGTPDYLFARQHINHGNYPFAAERLDSALGKQLPVERVVSETLRLRIQVACRLADAPTARAMLARYTAHPLVTRARAQTAAALVQRCTQ
ncbi:MAG: hypothetical protein JRI68_15590 [Deltaproteobacteria bacterium]|nr:hypothetical protein [Deltaproteobacteria bacterium]